MDFNLTIEQGATFYREVVWKDVGGAVVDLTGYTARMQVRRTIDSDVTLLDLSTTDGSLQIVTGATGSRVTITLSATETAAIDWTTARYDLEVEDTDGVVTRLLQGTVTVSQEVTR